MSAPLSPRAANASPNRSKAKNQDSTSGGSVEKQTPEKVPVEEDGECKENEAEIEARTAYGKLRDESADAKRIYVSPSDNILSPCTAKLQDLKGKKLARSGAKPTSLFPRASANATASASRSPEKNEKLEQTEQNGDSASRDDAPAALDGDEGADHSPN